MSRTSFLPRLAGAILATVASTAAADNLVFNGGFELGEAGWECVRHLRIETNPKMAFLAPVVDETEKHAGKRSLRVPNPFAEPIELFGRQLSLKPNTDYAVSLSAKASVPMKLTLLLVTAEWQVLQVPVQVGTDWRRLSGTVRTDGKANQNFAMWIRTGWQASDPAGDYWVDDVQVNEGADQPFQPSAQVEIAAMSRETVYQTESAPAAIELRMVNHGTKPAVGELALRLEEDEGGAPTAAGTVPVKLQPGENAVLVREIPNRRFGAMTVAVEAKVDAPTAVLPAWYTVIGKYERKPIDLNRQTCVSLNAGLPWTKAWTNNRPTLRCNNGPPEQFIDLMARMGCRMFRLWDGGEMMYWRGIEPEQGRFDFTYADWAVDLMLRNGIMPLPVFQAEFVWNLTGSLGAGAGEAWWVKPHVKDTGRRFANRPIVLPDMALYRAHVEALVGRYKGRISHWEVLNEANLFLTAAEYIPYLQTTHEAIKRIDPKATVVGFCSTGDLGGDVARFLTECFQLGGLKMADVVSWHPYDAPELGSTTPADAQITQLRSLVAKAGRGDVPLWNTELFYLKLGIKDEGSKDNRPHHVATRILTDLGEGVVQSASVANFAMWRQGLNPDGNNFGISSNLPSANYVVYNAFARLCEGAKPFARIGWGSDTVCYVYERDGRPIAACWAFGPAQNLQVSLPKEVGRSLDVYGNPQPAQSGPSILGRTPRYLEPAAGVTTAAFVAALRKAVLVLEQPLELGAVRLLPDGSGTVAVLALRNLTNAPKEAQIGLAGEGLSAAKPVTVALAALGETSVRIPVTISGGIPAAIDARMFCDGRISSINRPLIAMGSVIRAGKVAGKPISIARKGRDLPTLHKATFTASHDGTALTLQIEVEDATPSGAPGTRNPWDQDCVELFLDTAPGTLPFKSPEVLGEQVIRAFILPYAPADKQLIVGLGGGLQPASLPITSSVKVRAGGYSVVAKIPLRTLGVAGTGPGIIGVDIAVDDAAGASSKASQLDWSSAGQASRNRLGFGLLTFE